IEGAISASRNAVIGSVTLVGAIRRVLAAYERGHIDIPTRDILNDRGGGFAKCQRIACVGDDLSANFDHDTRWICLDRNGVVGPRNLHHFISHDLHPFQLETARRDAVSPPRPDRSQRLLPPSTLRTWPVMNDALFDAMKTMASAISS